MPIYRDKHIHTQVRHYCRASRWGCDGFSAVCYFICALSWIFFFDPLPPCCLLKHCGGLSGMQSFSLWIPSLIISFIFTFSVFLPSPFSLSPSLALSPFSCLSPPLSSTALAEMLCCRSETGQTCPLALCTPCAAIAAAEWAVFLPACLAASVWARGEMAWLLTLAHPTDTVREKEQLSTTSETARGNGLSMTRAWWKITERGDREGEKNEGERERKRETIL